MSEPWRRGGDWHFRLILPRVEASQIFVRVQPASLTPIDPGLYSGTDIWSEWMAEVAGDGRR
jgi:hypothetical protein